MLNNIILQYISKKCFPGENDGCMFTHHSLNHGFLETAIAGIFFLLQM